MLKNLYFAGILKVNDENSRIQDLDPDLDPDPLVRGMDPDPPQNVMNPQHCLLDTENSPFFQYLYLQRLPQGAEDNAR